MTALDVVIAPKTAFARLRTVPTWGWALLVAVVLAVIGSLLTGPAFDHYINSGLFQADMLKNPALTGLPPDRQDATLKQMVSFTKTIRLFTVVVVPISILLVALVQAVVMLVANAVGKGTGNFRLFWSLAINVAVVGVGIANLLLGAIIFIHGPDAITSMADFSSALPSLALFVPSTAVKLHTFLAAFNPVAIWAAVLLALGMRVAAALPPAVAAGTAAVIFLGSAGLGAAFAR